MNEYPKKRDLDGIYFLVEPDTCKATTVSAYDLLSDEDREALAWVREMGGIEAVEKRLMPEGMEWPKVDGKPVDFKTCYAPSVGALEAVSIYNNMACEVMGHDGIIKPASEIHAVVLAADGEPLEVGQTVYAPHYDYMRCTVLTIEWVVDGYLVEVENEDGHKFRQTPDRFIHQHSEPPDTWERIEEDAGKDRCSYFGVKYQDCGRCTKLATSCSISKSCDLVRRCKALAERGA